MMRKTLLFLVTLAFAVTASGQQRIAMHPKLSQQTTKSKYEFRSTHESTQRGNKLPVVRNHKAPDRATIIYDQPDGELKTYERSGGALYANSMGYLESTPQDGCAMNIVFAPDGNTVYLQDPISQYHNGAWVKAELGEDGKTITMPLNQYLIYFPDYGYGVITGWVDVTVDENDNILYSTNEDIHEVTYTMNEDGTISLNGTHGDIDTFEGSGLAMIYDDDFSWAGYIDWESVYTPFEGTPVTVPDGVEMEDFSMSYQLEDGSYGKMIKAGFADNDIYLTGISIDNPDGAIKGSINGDKVVFPSNQYMGVGSGYFLTMVGCDPEGEIIDNLEFAYDAATRKMTTDNVMAIVAGDLPLEIFEQPIIAPYINKAATPANPSVLEFVDEGSVDGYNYGEFSVPTVDTEGNFINPDDLYYRIYFDDDELFTFGPDEYPYVEGYMSDIPYNYTDDYDFGQGGSFIYFYETGVRRVGIQSVYRGGGEERVSDIVYYDLTDGSDPAANATADHYSGYCDDNSEASNVTSGRKQGYDIAIYVNDPSLKGLKVKGLRISAPSRTAVTEYTGWLSSKLGLKIVDGVKIADADIMSQTGAIADGHAEIMFDEPYEVGDDGFFAGYTIPVNNDKNPFMITSDDLGGGLWMHTTKALRNWIDMSNNGSACIELILEGQQETAAAIVLPANVYAKKGEPISVKGTLYNHGTTTLQSGEYTYEINGATGTVTLEDYLGGDHWGRGSELTIDLPAIAEAGAYPLTVTVTKVNDLDNQDAASARTTTVNVMDFVPVHRALVEEYTGTWCGWCTRGLVAMRMLAEQYGDNFIGVAYHNGDPMEIMYTFPSNVQGFPSAFVERNYDVDPYYGFAEDGFGMKDLVDYCMSELALADINVTADWADDSKTELVAKVETNFVMNTTGNDYAIEVMLVEDDMYGPAGSNWDQHNYYPSYIDSFGDDPDLGPLCYLPETIEEMHFNDVLVATSGVVPGSLPETITANEPNSFEYTFEVDYIYNTNYDYLIQNKDKLHVVAVIIDKATGYAVNANKAVVGANAVNELSDDDKVVDKTIYFDLTGHMVAQPTSGIYVKVVRYTDGSQRSFKVLMK